MAMEGQRAASDAFTEVSLRLPQDGVCIKAWACARLRAACCIKRG